MVDREKNRERVSLEKDKAADQLEGGTTQERRRSAGKLDYAVIIDEITLKIPGSEKKIRKGKCSKCGEFTAIGKERVLSYFFGMSSRYFCENCGRFIRGNPLMGGFAGLAETAVAILAITFLVPLRPVPSGSGVFSILFMALMVSVYDGCKRTIFSIAGIIRSYSIAKFGHHLNNGPAEPVMSRGVEQLGPKEDLENEFDLSEIEEKKYKALKAKYEAMGVDELLQVRESYAAQDYMPEARKALREVFIERKEELENGKNL
jgi:hypothetical protein